MNGREEAFVDSGTGHAGSHNGPRRGRPSRTAAACASLDAGRGCEHNGTRAQMRNPRRRARGQDRDSGRRVPRDSPSSPSSGALLYSVDAVASASSSERAHEDSTVGFRVDPDVPVEWADIEQVARMGGMASIYALPRVSQLPRQANDALRIASTYTILPWDAHPDALKFSKLSLASRERYAMDLGMEMAALQTAVKEAYAWQSPEEVPYLEAAIATIKDKKASIDEQWMASMEYAFGKMRMLWQQSKQKGKAASNVDTTGVDAVNDDQGETSASSSSTATPWRQASDDAEAHPYESFVDSGAHPTDAVMIAKQPSLSPGKKAVESAVKTTLDANGTAAAEDFYFYQSEDGRYIFLHPIYMRALRQEYGDAPEKLPDVVHVTPLNCEESTVTEELRKRFKFISHLPLGCDITFIDIDLPPLVSSQTLNKFTAALHERKQRLKSKQRRERREHARSERAMAQQQGSGGASHYAEYDASHFPAPSLAAAASAMAADTARPSDDAAVQEAWAAASANMASVAEDSATASQQSSSFANALRTSAAEAISRQEAQRLSAWTTNIPEETRVNRKGKKTLVLMSNHGRRRR
ncbi:hypothetical protein SYNPS1DRAFT_28569 [Syncephalis pseudoplumigaleata]|uniref:Uncharacterized protein n=1 Tax=Syncephalis pseudoplumigaleata TaxID=1712513 RepID=A0A4P9YZT7_9FUNG|nr:hypothetical protein SYNPS1DRAFT_28569 [Syncephalis pseudoplumigaleata]|eukprot:RKP25703.1 hypothetical protein SYNPS1DRAFT_28569 [Syncephalis pseudoplumigaleata]